MRKCSIEIIVKCFSYTSSLEVWQALQPMHDALAGKAITNEFTGKSITAKQIQSSLKGIVKNNFSFKVDDGRLYYNNPGNNKDKCGIITIRDIADTPEEAELWISRFLLDDRFIQARIFDNQYDFWQNQINIRVYENEGVSYSHLPTVHNGASPPLGKIIIDISNNLGRSLLRNNYMESIGSCMWLGESFWQATGVNKENILTSDNFKIETHGDIIKVIAQGSLFTESEGEQGGRQRTLRELLFQSEI